MRTSCSFSTCSVSAPIDSTQRHAGAHQRRELPRHDRDVRRRRPLEEREEIDLAPVFLLALALLGRLREHHAFAAQHDAQRLRVLGVAEALDGLAGRDLDSAEFEDRHGVPSSLVHDDVVLRRRDDLFDRRLAFEHLARAVVAQRVHALALSRALDASARRRCRG